MSTAFQIPRQTASTLTANGTVIPGDHTPVDATAGNITVTLPTGVSEGAHLAIEKTDATSNTVTISGTIRGVTTTMTLAYQYEVLELLAESSTSWRVTSNHLPKSAVDAKIAARAALDSATYSPLAQLAANPDELAVGTITRSTTGAATSFGVIWPDGVTGTFTGTESTTVPGAIDAYTITRVKAGTTITYTQPALTRNTSGAVTNRPAITVA